MKAYEAGLSSVPILNETVGANFERTAAAFPDVDALIDVPLGRRWTYAELDTEVNRVARGLMAMGISVGDRVGLWSPNCAQWVVSQYALAKIGAVLVNINPAYRASELKYVLEQSGTRTLLTASGFRDIDYCSIVEEVRTELPDLRDVLFIDDDYWPDPPNADAISPAMLRERLDSLSPSDPINIQYTSGTTGAAKGATLSHRNIVNNGFFVAELMDLRPAERLCIPVPFYHCFGMVMGNLGCTTHGATIVISGPGFEAGSVLTAIEQEQCSGVYGVPTMFIAMQNHPTFAQRDLTSLRTGIMAGSVCPVEVMKRCMVDMNMTGISIAYGMTETSPVSCQTRIDDSFDRRTASVGTAHPHIEVKIVDPETGQIAQRGEIGEICTRGYSVMLGYWRDDEATAAAIDSDGWMHTGDLAVMDSDGYCAIVGRIKDMVIRGGENIYPREIEDFLYTHPDIEDVEVIGVPDPTYGEEICAWIRMKTNRPPLDLSAIRQFCHGQIAHHKVPRYVHVVDEFPTTVTGKARKVEMRAQSVAIFDLGQQP